MLRFSKKNTARIHLYITILTCQTAFAITLPLIPYVNEELHANDLQYSLAFSGYYLFMCLSSPIFGSVSDRIGRKKTIVMSVMGLTIGNCLCFSTKTMNLFVLFRCITGFFDSTIYLCQAYMADITTMHERPKYLARLESFINITQCVGPLISALLSKINLYLPLWLAVGLFGFTLFYAIFFLPESVSSVIEKKEILRTFELVEHQQKVRQVSLLDYEESKQIQNNFLKSLQQQEEKRLQNAKLHFNYLMIIALIAEFCGKWLFSIFDTLIAMYGLEHYQIDAYTFSMMSVAGSLFNIFQTGWLFDYLVRKNFSIPTIASWTGFCTIFAIICCIAFDKSMFIIGGVLIIVSYGFNAPAPPAILSAESNDDTQGKAMGAVMMGGQAAQILSPLVLNNLYTLKHDLPFYVSLIPCIVLSLIMIICNYLPGGRLAGQVSLADSIESNLQTQMLEMGGDFSKKMYNL